MKPFIIPIFIPNHGCPNKCIYCDQNISIGQHSLPTSDEVSNIIDAHLKSAAAHFKPSQYTQVAFYGGTFTGLPFDTQENYLKTIVPYLKNKKVQSIRLSTRPGYINQQNLDLLKSFSVKTIELGVQSMDNEVLRLSQRGYTAQKVEESSTLIKENGFELGIQLMPGLPGDSENKIMTTSKQVCKIKPDFLRIYPTVVIKNTLLEKLYLKGEYTPLSLNRAVSIGKKMLLLFQSHSIPVIRMGLQPTETLLKPGIIVAGPFHPAFRELVSSSILYDRVYTSIKENLTGQGPEPQFGKEIRIGRMFSQSARRVETQGWAKSNRATALVSMNKFSATKNTDLTANQLTSKAFTFSVHPSELSTFIGNKKVNVKRLQKEFPDFDIRFRQDEEVQQGKFEVSNSIV